MTDKPNADPEDADAVDDTAPVETAAVEMTEPPEPPEPASQRDADEPAPAQPRQKSGFGAMLLGGAVVAFLGFVAGQAKMLDPFLPPSWRTPDLTGKLTALETRLADNTGKLSNEIAAIAVPDIAPLTQEIAGLAAKLTPLAGEITKLGSDIAELETRIGAVEKRPISEGVSQAAIDAYERELTRMKEALVTQRAEVEALIAQARSMEADASETQRTAALQNILTRLQTALIEGAPFDEILAELRSAGMEPGPDLAAAAGTGIATLASLRSDFPEAARKALADAREADKGAAPGFGAFLARQFGARSVEPRAGDDPDSILSRAEAAVTDGRIDTALTELAALPDAAKPALANWTETAARRQAVLGAADALARQLAGK